MEIKGSLAQDSLPGLLQGLQAFGASGVLSVVGVEDRRLEVGFESGRVAWAEQGHLVGEEALLSAILWAEGSYVFRSGEQEPHRGQGAPATSLPPGFDLTGFLLRAMVFADELEKRTQLLPPPGVPLQLKDGQVPEDPFGCGLQAVVDGLRRKQTVTLAELERELPLAPVKIQLAVALLSEQGLLAHQPAAPSPAVPPETSAWWAQVSERFGGSLRLLLVVDEATCTDAGFQRLVAFLKEKLGVSQAWESFAKSGPSFVRLHPQRGGVFSVCCLPSRQAAGRADYLAFVSTHHVAVAVGPAALPLLPALAGLGAEVYRAEDLDQLLGTLGLLGEKPMPEGAGSRTAREVQH